MSANEVSATELLSVRVEPDSPEMKAQSLLRPFSITGRCLILGRRGARRYVSDEADIADHLIAEPYPHTVSRQHCEIERTENEVIVRDLESRFGTVVDGQRLSGRRGRQSELVLGPGEHSLVLGRRHGQVRFRLIVG